MTMTEVAQRHPSAHLRTQDGLLVAACACGGKGFASPVPVEQARAWHAGHVERAVVFATALPPEIAWTLRSTL